MSIAAKIYARLHYAEGARPRCAEKHAVSRHRLELLATVCQLAITNEARTPAQQKALLKVCHDIDAEWNQVTIGNPFLLTEYGEMRRPFSRLEEEARRSYDRRLFEVSA